MSGPKGMVDQLPGYGGASADEVAFARAYLAAGEMDPTVLAMLGDAERIAVRDKVKAQRKADDFAALGHYRDANAALAGQAVDVVFIGDSITEMWAIAQPDLFVNGVIGRGVSGQTSAQILLRFMADVVALKPRAVHLMCGVNDVAGNTGPTTPEDYRNNIQAMVDLARARGVAVILGSLTPVTGLPWAPEVRDPRGRVPELNAWLRAFASENGLAFADYFAVLADADNALRAHLTRDGVHPQTTGYDLMRPIAEAAMRAVA
jgi:lysophospholipase L1-like esterase